MPPRGMNLKFLNNPAQRLAQGKGLPVHKLEAIIIYGTQVERMKVLKKILPQAFHLSLHAESYKVVMTLLTHCDNTIKTELLFAIRRKFIELSKTKNGNLVAQKLIETVPAQQKKEIAEMFVIGAEEDELLDTGRHLFGNRVISKLCEYSMCIEALEDVLVPAIPSLAGHAQGQHVVSRLIDSSDEGAAMVVKSLFPSGKPEDTEACEEIIDALPESTVLASLLKSTAVDAEFKEAIIMLAQTNVDEFLNPSDDAKDDDEDEFEETTFGEKPATAKGGEVDGKKPVRHTHFIAAAIEHGTDQDLEDFQKLLKPYMSQLAETTNLSRIMVALYKRCGYTDNTKAGAALRKAIVTEAIKAGEGSNAANAAKKQAPSLILRVAAAEDLTDFPAKCISELVSSSLTLCVDPCASPVLQALVSNHSNHANAVAKAMMAKGSEVAFIEAAKTVGGSILLQNVIEHAAESRDKIITVLLNAQAADQKKVAKKAAAALEAMKAAAAEKKKAGKKRKAGDDGDDANETAAADVEGEDDDQKGLFNLPSVVFTMAGSRLLQKVIAYAEDDQILKKIVTLLIPAEGKRFAILPPRNVALDKHGCYVLQALLPTLKMRGLDTERKAITDQLKRCVFDLAIYPWSGRIVLDTIFEVGSEALRTAIKEVIYLKTEEALSGVADEARQEGANHRSMMKAVNEGNKKAKRLQNGGDDEEDSSPKKKDTLEKKRVRKESAATDSAAAGGDAEKKKPAKKMFRSLKK